MQTELMQRESTLIEFPNSASQSQQPPREKLGPAYVLSAVVALLATAISITGLLFPSVYGGNWGSGTSIGNDLVTLIVAVPTVALAIVYSARGSVRARLLWLGALYFFFYNYAFYVFGIPVTKLYVPIIAAFALSGLALVVGCLNVDVEAIARRFSPRTPAKPIAIFLFLAAAMVSRLWLSQWITFFRTGRIPEVNGSASAYQVIAAVDLSFMVPVFFLTAYLLWRRRPWGYVLGVMTNVQGATYNAVMATVCVFSWKLTGSQLFSDWFISCIVGVSLCSVCLSLLLLSVKKTAQLDEKRVPVANNEGGFSSKN